MPRRLLTATFWRYEGWKLAAALTLASLAVAAALTVRDHDSHRLDRHVCVRVDNLDDVIVRLLERSQTTLNSNPFYVDHPILLAEAHRQNVRAIREFRDASC